LIIRRQTPPVAIGHQSEDKSAHRPKGKRHGDDQSNLRVGFVEVSRDGRQAKGHQKEVERVQQPPGESRHDSRKMATRNLTLLYALQNTSSAPRQQGKCLMEMVVERSRPSY
jgi:hypothetical protein